MTPLLTANSELRELGVWNWTLPAWVVQRTDGRTVNVCPSAGACAEVCYARNGTYRFPAVHAAHLRNLEMLDDLDGWATVMTRELGSRRFYATGVPRLPEVPRGHLHPRVARRLDVGAACIRVHDSGDFFSEAYLRAWFRVATARPGVLFYAYTKEVALLEGLRPEAPPNFLWVYSLGGRQDRLVDRETMRHADVFPDEAAIAAAGYVSQDAHDLLCVVHPSLRIGIPTNNIPAFRKRQAGRTFSGMQADRHRLPVARLEGAGV